MCSGVEGEDGAEMLKSIAAVENSMQVSEVFFPRPGQAANRQGNANCY